MLRFPRSRAGDVHACLDNMDSLDNVGVGIDIVLNARYGLRVGKQSLHLGLGTAVTQLQVIEHGVVLLCEALIRRLYGRHVGAHLIGVVRHVGDCHIGVSHRLLGVSAQRGDKARGEGRDRLHVLVGGKARRPVRVRCVFLQPARRFLKECIYAADELLIIGKSGYDLLAEAYSGSTGRDHNSAERRSDGL